jgi:hypothetical protein
LEGSTLPQPIKQKLANIGETESFHRQLFIRQTHKRSEKTRCFIVKSSEADPSIARVDVATCDGPVTSLDAPDAHPVVEPMFLVCTHGNHDKCCAKFGLPVFYAAREAARGQAWQCSHVGGDRFAGNMICFPHGVYYGHVAPGDVPGLINAYQRGEIDLRHYRGRCCYSKPVQVAEYFVRAETGLLRIDHLHLETASRIEGGWTVRFRGVNDFHEVSFRGCEPAEPQYLTCQAERANPIPRYEMTSLRSTGR